MFEFTAAWAIMAAPGIAYLLVAGHWLLPNREALANLLPRSEDRHFMAHLLVPLGSPMVGTRLQDAGFPAARGLRVIDLIRRARRQGVEVGGAACREGRCTYGSTYEVVRQFKNTN